MADAYAKVLVRAGVATYEDASIAQGEYLNRMMTAARPVTDELDSEGMAWDAALHTANRQMTKDGRWRRKPGASK